MFRCCITVHRCPLFFADVLCLSKVESKKSEIEEKSARSRTDAFEPLLRLHIKMNWMRLDLNRMDLHPYQASPGQIHQSLQAVGSRPLNLLMTRASMKIKVRIIAMSRGTQNLVFEESVFYFYPC